MPAEDGLALVLEVPLAATATATPHTGTAMSATMLVMTICVRCFLMDEAWGRAWLCATTLRVRFLTLRGRPLSQGAPALDGATRHCDGLRVFSLRRGLLVGVARCALAGAQFSASAAQVGQGVAGLESLMA